MSSSDNDPSRSQIPYFQPPPGLPPLPPETYTYLIQALLSLRGSAYPPTSAYPILPWPPDTASAFPGPSSFRLTPLPPYAIPQSPQLTPTPVASPATTSTAQDPEGTEDATSAEDKRRRNTAASARFRIKKKLKTLNLERAVADLNGRTEELEQEAHDLRRENAWLKEIVLLKSRHLTGSQATALANQPEKDDLGHAGSSRTRG